MTPRVRYNLAMIRRVTWCAFVVLAPGLAAPRLSAQDDVDPAAAQLAQARDALAAWLASDHTDATLLGKTVSAISRAGAAAIEHLGARAKAANDAADKQAGRGLDAVITHFTVAYLKRETESGMLYEGQYDGLRPLQPFVGKLLLNLLLETPDWFSSKERHLLVFPLRDVFPTTPGDDVCKRLREIATDEDFEPDALRQNLAFALAQWGNRTLIEARIAQVSKDALADDISDERRAALRYELADIHYNLREYDRAAKIHVDMLRQAEATGTDLLPTHYYNAACCLARAGAADAALNELERAGKLMQKGVDPSHRVARKLFELDPDLASVRGHARFRAIVRATFPDAPKMESGAGKRSGG